MIDTGAARTIGEKYTANPTNDAERAEVNTVGGSAMAQIVLTYLTISGKRFRIPLVVAQGSNKKLGFDILIGQDVLAEFASVKIDYANHVVIFETK